MNIGTYGFIDPASGIAGIANFDGTLTSNGSQAKAIGTFTGTKLTLAPKGTPAPKTVVIKHTVDVDLDNESGTVDARRYFYRQGAGPSDRNIPHPG